MMKPLRRAPFLLFATALSLGTGCIDTDGLFFPGDASGAGGTGGGNGGGASTGGGNGTGGSTGDTGGAGGTSGGVDYRSEVLADGPVAYWPLDAFDGNGRTESLVGDITANIVADGPDDYDADLTGRIGGGVRVDRRADVGVPAPHSLGFGDGSYSFEAWVRHSGTEGSQGIVSCATQGSPVGLGFVTNVGPTGLNHKRYDGTASESASTDQTDLTQWTHVVITHDDVDDETQLYIDGQPFLTPPAEQVFAWQHQARFLLVQAGFEAGQTIDADEIAVYDKVLAEARVQRHYACADGCPD